MIPRILENDLVSGLEQFPAVALLGPRQVGKTTLALAVADRQDALYLDLERPSDAARLSDAELFLGRISDRLVIIDEVQRSPGLFRLLRSEIDRRRRGGEKAGQFLLLGSASDDLLQQSSESLAGRILYLELGGLLSDEVGYEHRDRLWLRGGFPESFEAESDAASLAWRNAFIRTYLERELLALGLRLPSETLRRFWTMLAHTQGSTLNAANIAAGLGVSGQTVRRYLDILVDLMLVRRLEPFSENVGKRLVRSPKIYLRDTGLMHALLGIESYDGLLGHPAVGGSWEGFVLEHLIAHAPRGTTPWLYRTQAGAEIDLLLVAPDGTRTAVEVKRSLAPKASRGFRVACEDLAADHRMIVTPGEGRYPIDEGIEVVGLGEAIGGGTPL